MILICRKEAVTRSERAPRRQMPPLRNDYDESRWEEDMVIRSRQTRRSRAAARYLNNGDEMTVSVGEEDLV